MAGAKNSERHEPFENGVVWPRSPTATTRARTVLGPTSSSLARTSIRRRRLSMLIPPLCLTAQRAPWLSEPPA